MLTPDNNYNCVVSLDDGTTINVYANKLHNQEMDFYQNWVCLAGHTRLYLDNTGDLYSCEQKDQYLGNINGDWSINSTGHKCEQTRCGACTDDLMTEKYEK